MIATKPLGFPTTRNKRSNAAAELTWRPCRDRRASVHLGLPHSLRKTRSKGFQCAKNDLLAETISIFAGDIGQREAEPGE